MKFYQTKLAIAVLGTIMAAPAMAGDKSKAPDFSELDSNNDKRLELNELQSTASNLNTEAETLIQRNDRNQDSALSKREYKTAIKQEMKAKKETAGLQSEENDELAAGERSQITVDQKPAKVNIHKPAAQVTVKQPQPEVTITTRDPEVEVSQPDPEVSVDQAEPDVSVNQAAPEVAVDQSEPVVDVDQEEPEVEITEREPAVAIEERSVQPEESQSDQPITNVEDGERIRAPLAGTDPRSATGPETSSDDTLADMETDASTREVPAAYNTESEPSSQSDLYTMSLDELRSGDIMDSDGEKYGSITDVMIKRDGRGAGLVLTRADDKTILFAPLNAIGKRDDRLVLNSESEAGEVGPEGEYSLNDYISAPNDAETLGEAMNSNPASTR